MDKFNQLYENTLNQYNIKQIDEAALRLPKNQKIVDLLIINHIYDKINLVKNTNTLYNKGTNYNEPDPNKKLKDDVIKALNNISDYMKIVDQFNTDFKPQFSLTDKEINKRLNQFKSLDSRYIYKLVKGIKQYRSRSQSFVQILATI